MPGVWFTAHICPLLNSENSSQNCVSDIKVSKTSKSKQKNLKPKFVILEKTLICFQAVT